jgi:hypothetical protein
LLRDLISFGSATAFIATSLGIPDYGSTTRLLTL